MDYLVTGATGFVGQHLVGQLLAAGAELTLLVREGYAGMPLPEAELRHCVGLALTYHLRKRK